MATELTQEGLAEALRLDEERFNHLVRRLSDSDQSAPFTPEGWSVKDYFAHMAHWNQAAHAFLVAFVHDQPYPPAFDSGDEANAVAREQYASLSLQEAQNFWRETHTHLLHLIVDELDNERLSEEVRVPWDEHDTATACTLVADMCEHDGEHLTLIESHFNQ